MSTLNLARMIKFVVISVLSLSASVLGQLDLLEKLKVVDANPYFARIVQETIYEIEKIQWCSFKLDDFKQTLNEITHTNKLVTGEVSYSNGFLVSVEKIYLTMSMHPLVSSRVVNNATVTSATVRGLINFRNVRVGYDVMTNVTNLERQRRYTGIFTHSLIEGRLDITKNMNTNEMSVWTSVPTVSAGSGVRMVYMPMDDMSEILSLRFVARSTDDNAEKWMKDIIGPIVLNIAKTKIPFPELCFNC